MIRPQQFALQNHFPPVNMEYFHAERSVSLLYDNNWKEAIVAFHQKVREMRCPGLGIGSRTFYHKNSYD